MSDASTPAQGAAGTSQGGEGKSQLGPDGKPWDFERQQKALETQRESEKAARDEAATARAELKALKDQIDADKAKAEDEAKNKLSEAERTKAEIADLQRKLTDGDAAARARIARAGLKAAAAAAGAIYPGDIPALVDTDAVKFDREGEPSNTDALVAALKESRPALFKEPRKPGSFDGGARRTADAPADMNALIRQRAGH